MKREQEIVLTKDIVESRYRAPALEKGLDILELLAREASALTMSQLSDRLGRSKGEIFRMLQVLEERAYIARRPGEDGYSLTNRLFMLGIERPPMRGLLEVGLPVMHRLAEDACQSCHLAVASLDQIVIVARVEAPGAMGFSVRLGHRVPLTNSNSGAVLLAWQPAPVAAQWGEMLGKSGAKLGAATERRLKAVRAAGHSTAPSPAVRGVTDVSAPILQSGYAIAALTVPFVDTDDRSHDLDTVTRQLKGAAAEISEAVRIGGSGPLDVGPEAIETIVGAR